MSDPHTHATAEAIDLAGMLQAGLTDHRDGRSAEARRRYRQLLSIEPRIADAWHLLGLLDHAARRSREAERQIARALYLDADVPLYLFNLGNVHAAAERTEAAAACFERVLGRAPDHEGAARHLGNMRTRMALSPDALDRCRRRWGTSDQAILHPEDERRCAEFGAGHLLIRGWGCGFWGEVNHVAAQLALAEITGRQPVVYWGKEVRYRAPGIENAWEAYFEPVSPATIADMENAGRYFPGRWTAATLRDSDVQPMREPAQINTHGIPSLALLNRPEPVAIADGYQEISDIIAWTAPRHPYAKLDGAAAARSVFDRRIRPNRELRQRIETLAARHLSQRPTMAIHCRAQNHFKQAESLERIPLSPGDYWRDIDAFLVQHPTGSLFLLCDVQPTVDQFIARYGDRLIALPRQRLNHGYEFDLGLDHARDGHQLALEVLEDAYLAAECDYFLGDGASGVSCSIAVLKDWPEGRLRLLRRNVFHERRGGHYMA